VIDLKDIQSVRSQFGMDEEGCFWSGEFILLLGDLVVASARHKNEILTQILQKHRYILQDLSNLGMVLFKLEWIRSHAQNNDSLKSLWFQFATTDIDYFHVEFRSIFDYVAKIIGDITNKPGQITDSFHRLQERLNKPGNRARLGEELAKVVESVDWFPDVQRLRDTMIHSGSFPHVFSNPEKGILFQSYQNSVEPSITDEMVMYKYNRDVVDFQLYSALYLCKLLLFLDELAKIVRSKLSIKKGREQAKSYSPGLELILSWLDRLTERIKT
jgi:hypothetical protein